MLWVEVEQTLLGRRNLYAMAIAAGSKVSKQMIQSPNMALSYLVSVASLLTGAAVVHNIFKPDLVSLALRSCSFTISCSLAS